LKINIPHTLAINPGIVEKIGKETTNPTVELATNTRDCAIAHINPDTKAGNTSSLLIQGLFSLPTQYNKK